MYKHTLVSKLLSSDLKKNIIECGKFRKDPSKRNLGFLKIIQNMDQIMLGAGTAKSENLILVLQVKHMWKSTEVVLLFAGKNNGFDGNSLAGFNHLFQLFFGAGCNNTSFVHDSDSGADLFHFSYQRYIENQIRSTFGLTGTPVRFVVRERARDEK